MEILVIFAVAVIISMMLNRKSDEMVASEKLVVKKKQCPPHAWQWQEIVDQDGNRQGDRIVCDKCGPLSKSLDGSVE